MNCQSQTEQILKAQNKILKMVAKEDPIEVIIEAASRLVEVMIPNSECSIILSGNKEDMHNNPENWSTPIVNTAGEMIGVFTLLFDNPREPNSFEIEVVTSFSYIVRLVYHRDKLEKEKLETLSTFQLAQAVIDNSPIVIMRWKAEEGWPLQFVSENVTQFGYTTEELLDGSIIFSSMVHPDDLEGVSMEVEEYTKNGTDRFIQEYRILTKDGKVRWIDDRTTVIRDQSGNVLFYQGTILDITVRKVAEQQVKYLADYDPLTNLPNRRYFHEKLNLKLKLAKSKTQQMAILFIDIDNFKEINDILGHSFGDQFLIKIAERLNASIPANGMIARVSGDEFTVFLSNIKNVEEATSLSKKILESINEPMKIDNYNFNITGSIGISRYPQDGSDSHTLVKNADIAMYEAKRKSKNTYQIFSKEIHDAFLKKNSHFIN